MKINSSDSPLLAAHLGRPRSIESL